MILERGNIELVRLMEEHIELVRHWRNDPSIQNTMQYREHISAEMQQKWFQTINNKNNNYFLIRAKGIFIGVISGGDIDWVNNITKNGGIFIWDKTYYESPEILNAALLLTDLGFYMGMEKNYVRILSDNIRSITFNRSLGYELMPGQENEYNQKYILLPHAYFKATEKIRRHFGFSDDIKLIFTPQEHEENKEFEIKFDEHTRKFGEIISVRVIVK